MDYVPITACASVICPSYNNDFPKTAMIHKQHVVFIAVYSYTDVAEYQEKLVHLPLTIIHQR